MKSTIKSCACLILIVLVRKAAPHGDHHHNDNHRGCSHQESALADHRRLEHSRNCGTRTLTHDELEKVEAEMAAWKEDHGCTDTHCPEADQIITIPTVWHSIAKSDGSAGPSPTMITDAINALNGAYASAGFQFALAGETSTNNDAYYGAGPLSIDELAMKTALRQGDQSTLNIYSTGTEQVSGILGWAFFPSDYTNNPTLDGVVIGTQTNPGGTVSPYNLGDTLVHEVGHWLHLYHVFQGSSCGGNGDYVADTPPQSDATSGCPVCQNSCSDEVGRDSIHNYMDYSDDSCMDHFTPGQITRMKVAWNTYRANGTALPTAPVAPTTPAPSMAPVTPCPNNPSPGAPTSNFCFSEQSSVSVQNKGLVNMPNLVQGDQVLTANGYQTLYGFGHKDSRTDSEFLQIYTEEHPERPLEITPQHLLFVVGKSNAVPASSIRPGDALKGSQWSDEHGLLVKKIARINRKGIYAPVTSDGTVVVDGIVSSCYIALQNQTGEYMEMKGGITLPISQHFFYHLALTPARMVCLGVSASLCNMYDEEGLAYFAKIGFTAFRWADSLSLPVQIVLIPWYLMGMGMLYALEFLFGPKLALLFIVVSAAVTSKVVRCVKGSRSQLKKKVE